jgi:alpha-ribazole phosphatase
MNDILLIRHAETDMAGTFCGHSDPELNARGRAQLPALIDSLREENIGAVYTSDLRRAQETAQAIADAFAVELHVRPGLREISFGSWEGLTWSEIEHRDEAYARRWIAEYPDLPAPGGEPFCDFQRRILEEVESLSTKFTGCNVAVITHAGVLRTVLRMRSEHSDEDAWKLAAPYCAIVRHPVTASASTRCLEVGS